MKQIVFYISFSLILFICGCELLNISSGQSGNPPLDTADLTVIGHGYDVFDNYADPEQVKAAIVDVDGLNKGQKLQKQILEKGIFSSSWGTSFSEYSSSLNVKTNMEGSYSFYSGSIKANFSETRFSSSEYHFATVHSDIKKYSIKIDNSSDLDFIKANLTSSFKTAVNKPEDNCYDIFRTYGTHLLTGIIMGARLDYSLSAKSESNSGSMSVNMYANAQYKSLFKSASIEVEVDSSTNWSNYYSNTEVKTIVIGGKSEFAQSIHNDNDYQNWINSIDENPVFSNILANGMIPVWELTDNSTKKALLMDKFHSWAKDKSLDPVVIPPPAICIIDIRAENTDKGNIMDYNGRKYYKINQDLNEGAGGDDIFFYVCYGKSDGSDGLMPVKNIAVTYDADWADAANHDRADNYERVDLDLNRGAGGDYMYLCINRTDAGPPVTNIYVMNESDGGEKHFPYNHGFANLNYTETDRMKFKVWSGERADLNRGAGGDYLYLFWSKDALQ